ncbi:AcrR family transcriptional regulator [Streptosporangium album]|uniref:AcrR family transcriptional regulator n=1 Tax=Streptosporangium album TaxID=47479 RepID=A0A7W7WDS7_9ACTN|nr:AcrR family transcriptional regulator [Streptosporangium album]
MQRVAGDLGFTKMSLYRYVSSKADLVAVMIESAVGDPPDLSRVEGGWRARLTEFTRLLADAWKRRSSDAFTRILDRHGAVFPALVAATSDLGDTPHDNGRRFGLECVLDGLAARIAAASGA